MFSVAIDKFKRMMDLRRARYKRSLETKFPFLDVEYGDGTSLELEAEKKETSLLLRVKADYINLPPEEWKVAKEVKFVLSSDILVSTQSYIASIYMFDDDNENTDVRKRVMNNVDMLWSLLFKTSTPSGLGDEELLDRCLKEIDIKTGSGPLSMFNSYKREAPSFQYFKSTLTDSIVELNLEITGEATMELIKNLKQDHMRLAKTLIEIDKEQAKRWSFF
jgi:hypothetical protein